MCCQQAGGRRPSNSSSSVNISSLSGELRYRDKYLIRHIEIYDKEDDDSYRKLYTFTFLFIIFFLGGHLPSIMSLAVSPPNDFLNQLNS